MFNRLRRSIAKATKLTRSGNLFDAVSVFKMLAAPAAKPVRKKRAAAAKPRETAKPALTKALVKPRSALGETVRRISAGGMPARPALTTIKPVVSRGASFKTASYSNEHGKRSYKIYVPAQLASSPRSTLMPLVVMLHGCSQTPDDFALGTGLNRLADEFGVIVAYPAQPVGANANKCWNWFKRTDQARDGGEPALIAGITRKILRDHLADPGRVYIAGLSAGGAAAAITANVYPDIFAAVGVHSGLPIGAAHDAASAFVAMRQGAPGSRQSVAMPTIIFHGADDTVVHPRNGRAIAARSVATFSRLDEVVKQGKTSAGTTFSKTVHRAANGKSFCEYWALEGVGHAWSGGNLAGSYTDTSGPDASREMLRFFLQHKRA